jgi:Phosphoesterase family
MGAGDNSWQAMHEAYNDGLTNQWVSSNTPYSWGYFERSDIPVHFDIAEGWTVGDMYQVRHGLRRYDGYALLNQGPRKLSSPLLTQIELSG